MLAKPKFITFTGADEHTDRAAMRQLASEYPIEWGILFSPMRQGAGRYPPMEWISDLLRENNRLKYAAHICGAHSRALLQPLGKTAIDSFILDVFDRVQINTSDPAPDIEQVNRWASIIGAKPILQCRGEYFPDDDRVLWLFDASGGRGITPGFWARAPIGSKNPHGYAGGLNPENVARHLPMIEWESGTEFWIDMESGVRDESDRFDLRKCRAVCEAVYGKR